MANYTIDSKYIAVCDVAKEVVWLKEFITSLDVVPSIINQLTCIVMTMCYEISKNQTHT